MSDLGGSLNLSKVTWPTEKSFRLGKGERKGRGWEKKGERARGVRNFLRARGRGKEGYRLGSQPSQKRRSAQTQKGSGERTQKKCSGKGKFVHQEKGKKPQTKKNKSGRGT